MEAEQLQFIFSLFSFVGVVGILFYLVLTKAKSDEQLESVEILEQKMVSLQDYVYELEERTEVEKTPEQHELKQKIIEMFEDGKELMVIENALDVPRAKIEMILKFHKLQTK
jgi:uncharacterized protein YqhQ